MAWISKTLGSVDSRLVNFIIVESNLNDLIDKSLNQQSCTPTTQIDCVRVFFVVISWKQHVYTFLCVCKASQWKCIESFEPKEYASNAICRLFRWRTCAHKHTHIKYTFAREFGSIRSCQNYLAIKSNWQSLRVLSARLARSLALSPFPFSMGFGLHRLTQLPNLAVAVPFCCLQSNPNKQTHNSNDKCSGSV